MTLLKAVAGDVLEPEVNTFVMSLRGPNGELIVEETDLLNSKNAGKEITIKLEEYGSYSLNYIVTDASGRRLSWSQNLNVRDDIAPTIAVEKKLVTTATVGKKVTVSKATATDNLDGDITTKIITTGTIDINVAGTYTVTYTVSDTAGNVATITRTVKVEVAQAQPTTPVEPGTDSTTPPETPSDSDITNNIVQ